MSRPSDVRPVGIELYLIPIKTRVPLKFGPEITTEVVCARVRATVADVRGAVATGWGETPLSVQWVWPGTLSYDERLQAMLALCDRIAGRWLDAPRPPGHPIELGWQFLEHDLPAILRDYNAEHRPGREPVPWLAALVCASAFDLAIHDAFGVKNGIACYDAYDGRFLSHDLSAYLEPSAAGVCFDGRFPADFLAPSQPSVPAWHLIGGKDPITPDELTGEEPDDGLPVLLQDWIRRDGLFCLKVKLKGDDPGWDLDRLVSVWRVAEPENVRWLSADFNCTVRDPGYVTAILDQLLVDHPRLYGALLYVEQPFPYDLEANPIDVRSVSARKPLFMDESAHDWRLVRLGRELGWTGVALKTCKTQTGALLSMSWARAHGMTLMVQDLSNPMLAQIPHLLLGARAGTIMGVESNGMQYYPAASEPEARVHPGLYRRAGGRLALDSIRGPGFGMRVEEIGRKLDSAAFSARLLLPDDSQTQRP